MSQTPLRLQGKKISPSISNLCAQTYYTHLTVLPYPVHWKGTGRMEFFQERVASLEQRRNIEREKPVYSQSAVPIWMFSLASIPVSLGTSVSLQAVNTSKRGNEALRTVMFKSVVRFISKCSDLQRGFVTLPGNKSTFPEPQ